MATNELKNLEGFILREINYKESSKILEVYTKDLGRVSVLARGAKRPKSKMGAATLRFSKSSFNLYKSGKDFYGAGEINLLENYPLSSKKFDIIVYKSAICDLLLRTYDFEERREVYKLLDSYFKAFEGAEGNFLTIYLSFFIKYPSFLGVKPNLSTCGICGKKIGEGDLFFSPQDSSMVCRDDLTKTRGSRQLSKEEFTYIRALLYTPSGELETLKEPEDMGKLARLVLDSTLSGLEISRYNSVNRIYKKIDERKKDVF